MSLVGFDTLRANHRDELDGIVRLEQLVRRAVAKNRDARLDELSLSSRTNLPISIVELFLVELCQAGALEARAFWNCPNGHGVAEEAEGISDFPPQVECGCGHLHDLETADLEIGFIASLRLRDDVQRPEQ